MTDFVSIDDMINARQQAQPGFKKANPSSGMEAYAAKLQASEDVPEEKKDESEKEITQDEVREADTPEGKEDVRVGTEEAAARDDKAKAIEELGKAKEDEEKAEFTVIRRPIPTPLSGYSVDPVKVEEDWREQHDGEYEDIDIDSLIADRQWVPPMDFDIVGEDAESLTVRDPKTGETFVIPKG